MSLDIFDPVNLAPWCAVPYDAVQRSPHERAQMFASLGFTRAAWDWRPEHVAQFPAQLDAFEAHEIDLLAIWVSAPLPGDGAQLGVIDADAVTQIEEAARRGLTPQVWVCTEFGPEGPAPVLSDEDQRIRVERTATHLEPLARLAARHGMTLGLYMHLGWAGEPDNLLQIADALAARGLPEAGVVYMQHHGHAHVDAFADLWPRIQSRVVALGLNGMVAGPGTAHKIYPYGRGPADVDLARVVVESEWHGPVCVLSHTMDDARDRLLDNLEGLAWVRAVLEDAAAAPTAPPPARVSEPRWPH